MPISALAGLAFGVAVVAIGLYHVAFVGPKFRTMSRVLKGEGDAADGESLAVLRANHSAFATALEARLTELERSTKRDACRVGFLRFNAFEDVGSDQSFTLALLNNDGNGVVLTSIYSREDTRTYGKAVRKFLPQQGASSEEQSAIAMARTGVGI